MVRVLLGGGSSGCCVELVGSEGGADGVQQPVRGQMSAVMQRWMNKDGSTGCLDGTCINRAGKYKLWFHQWEVSSLWLYLILFLYSVIGSKKGNLVACFFSWISKSFSRLCFASPQWALWPPLQCFYRPGDICCPSLLLPFLNMSSCLRFPIIINTLLMWWFMTNRAALQRASHLKKKKNPKHWKDKPKSSEFSQDQESKTLIYSKAENSKSRGCCAARGSEIERLNLCSNQTQKAKVVMFGFKELKVAAAERFQIYVVLHKRKAASACLLQTSGTDVSGLRGLAGQ